MMIMRVLMCYKLLLRRLHQVISQGVKWRGRQFQLVHYFNRILPTPFKSKLEINYSRVVMNNDSLVSKMQLIRLTFILTIVQ